MLWASYESYESEKNNWNGRNTNLDYDVTNIDNNNEDDDMNKVLTVTIMAANFLLLALFMC